MSDWYPLIDAFYLYRRALSDEELPGSCKRSRLLAPHLYCSMDRSCRNLSEDNESMESSTGSDISTGQSDDGLSFPGRGPKNNSTPRTTTSNEKEVMMPMPQAMPVRKIVLCCVQILPSSSYHLGFLYIFD